MAIFVTDWSQGPLGPGQFLLFAVVTRSGGTKVFMADRETVQVIVLQSIVDRLIREIGQFEEANCFITAQPPSEPPAGIRHNLFCTVSPSDGQFDQSVHEGAGIEGTYEYAAVQIVIFNSVKLGQPGHDAAMLSEDARGLLVLKFEILKALSGHDLKDSNGKTILVNLMAPLRAESPHSSQENPVAVGDLSIMFSTDFQWDLT